MIDDNHKKRIFTVQNVRGGVVPGDDNIRVVSLLNYVAMNFLRLDEVR